MKVTKLLFERVAIVPVAMDFVSPILAGSVGAENVAVSNTVTVEDYTYGFSENGGINDAGFDVDFGE